MWSFIFGGHNGRHELHAGREKSRPFVFSGKVSDKAGEEHYIVDTTGHFLSERGICQDGVREGYLIYSGYARINGVVRHTYYLTDPPLME